MNKLLDTEELAEYLKLSVGTVNNRISRGDPMPPSYKIGRKRLYPVNELEKWLNQRLTSNDEMETFSAR